MKRLIALLVGFAALSVSAQSTSIRVDGATVSSSRPLPTTALTDTQLRATPVPVTGPATDTQLRATPLPVTGPVTDTQLRATALPVSGPLTDTQLRATPVPISASTIPLPTGAATSANQTNGTAKTQIVTPTGDPLGTVADPIVTELDTGATVDPGQKTMSNSFPVVLPSDQSAIPVSQSGTWTVNPGNTANTTAWKVTGEGGTFPVSGLPTSLGQKTASNSTSVTLPSDGTLPLPTGAATSANQTNGTAKTQLVDGAGTSFGTAGNPVNVDIQNEVIDPGQTTMAASFPVTIASNQSALSVASGIPASATAWSCNLASGQTGTVQCGSTAATGKYIAVTSMLIGIAGASGTVAIVQGTGTNCGTGQSTLLGAFSLNQNAGISLAMPAPILVTSATAQALCLTVTGGSATGAIYLSGYTY